MLDTHALLWWLDDDDRLPGKAEAAISEAAEVFVSAATIWEVATKFRIGKLPNASKYIYSLEQVVIGEGFVGLPVNLRHGHTAGLLDGPHRDPFGRMLIAQALTENLTLISNERLFDDYGVARLW